MKVFLIGYMGSGKSKVAEALGKIMDLPVVHTDELVEEAEGKSIQKFLKPPVRNIFGIWKKKHCIRLQRIIMLLSLPAVDYHVTSIIWST